MELLHIGFTGTRQGMTSPQRAKLTSILQNYSIATAKHNWFHHGDCIGADAQAHEIALNIGYLIHICPSDLLTRAHCKHSTVCEAPQAAILRNHHIVDASHILIACPKSPTECLRSGTWATVRYARRASHQYLIINPDGCHSSSEVR